jgi:hypothetical protein
MSRATGEHCVVASNPANLAAQLTSAQPDGIGTVAVSIRDISVAADINPVGGWRAKFTLGKGSYTAKATATLTSGHKVSASRSLSVGARPDGPKPGTVKKGPGAHRATVIVANRPPPRRSELPADVTGAVGLLKYDSLVPAKRLNGATVVLQGRNGVGGTWVTLDRAKVKAGKYALHWKPRWGIHAMRVSLQGHRHLAPSSNVVPNARISGCKVDRRAHRWSMTCHTTAKNGAKVRLYKDHTVVDRTKVASGLVKVHASGKPAGRVLAVKLSRKHHSKSAHLSF